MEKLAHCRIGLSNMSFLAIINITSTLYDNSVGTSKTCSARRRGRTGQI
jgi:hypothetical protein